MIAVFIKKDGRCNPYLNTKNHSLILEQKIEGKTLDSFSISYQSLHEKTSTANLARDHIIAGNCPVHKGKPSLFFPH